MKKPFVNKHFDKVSAGDLIENLCTKKKSFFSQDQQIPEMRNILLFVNIVLTQNLGNLKEVLNMSPDSAKLHA